MFVVHRCKRGKPGSLCALCCGTECLPALFADQNQTRMSIPECRFSDFERTALNNYFVMTSLVVNSGFAVRMPVRNPLALLFFSCFQSCVTKLEPLVQFSLLP